MKNGYEDIPSNQIEKQKRHFYGALINILHLHDDNSPMWMRQFKLVLMKLWGVISCSTSSRRFLQL